MSEAPDTTLETGVDAPAVDSRREQLNAAFDALDTGDEEEGSARARDEKGRFAPTGEKEAEPAPVEATPEPLETPEAPEPVAVPQSWKKDYHEAFQKADPQLRQYIMQREDEMRAGIEHVIPKAKFADEVLNTIQPFQTNIQAAGISPTQAIQTLMQADHILRNAPMDQKRQYAVQLLAQYGVDLTGAQGGEFLPFNPAPAPNPVMPELQSLRTEVLSLKQQEEARQQAALNAEVEAFSRDKPYFESVRPAMAQLLTSGQASSLDDAYEKALEPWKATLEAAERGKQAAAEFEKRKAADAAAKAAKAAAVQVRSSTPGRAPQPNAKDRRSMLLEQLDGISDRV